MKLILMENLKMNDYAKITEQALNIFLPSSDCREKVLIDSMRYSLDAGGKRVRPTLVFEFNKFCKGNIDSAKAFACAVEMVHTYSLVHDDLPCMDDDDLRRGKPSNHKVFGYANALLSGDALLTLAFETLTSDYAVKNAGYEACCKGANTLAKYAGAKGMVAGQVIDLDSENKNVTLEVLKEMDYKKTACLIMAACELGCISAGASEKYINAASTYGKCIGIAFQIQDDILDVISTDKELGKPVGSDKENNKSTYVSLLGLDKCKEIVTSLTDEAISALKVFDEDTSELEKFAYSLAKRNK